MSLCRIAYCSSVRVVLDMKDCVDIESSGRDVTTIRGSAAISAASSRDLPGKVAAGRQGVSLGNSMALPATAGPVSEGRRYQHAAEASGPQVDPGHLAQAPRAMPERRSAAGEIPIEQAPLWVLAIVTLLLALVAYSAFVAVKSTEQAPEFPPRLGAPNFTLFVYYY